MDDLGLVEAVDGFGESIVVRVADATHRGLDAGLRQALGVFDRDVLGGFNWLSQHRDGRGCDGGWATFGSGTAGQAAIARATSCSVAGASATVLGVDCRGALERGRGDEGWSITAGRISLVPHGRRYGPVASIAFI